ncbi:MAG: HAD family hydrolase [Candidatus Marinimicrobia bacterium]|nr:HAD family hydrolase [Candidatus Neomarinimicrobiota bacterium]
MTAAPEIKIIGFDADDTLWDNEPYYRSLEDVFCEVMKDILPPEESSKELYKTEVSNLPLYGYGSKAYTLSILETALRLSREQLPAASIARILKAGKQLSDSPLKLLDHVETVLQNLAPYYKLIVVTKGDLIDQERKLKKSRLERYFHHIEIMSDKQPGDYEKLFRHLDIRPEEFLMVGNSLRSDILPVVELGGYAVHIPYHTTWLHEKVGDIQLPAERFREIASILKLLDECPWIKLKP